MRVRIIAASVVLIVVLGFGVWSQRAVYTVLDDMADRCTDALVSVDAQDWSGGKAALVRAETYWSDHSFLLEALTPHEDLHDVKTHCIEASTGLARGDYDDFYTAMALLEAQLKHLKEHESIRWENIL